MIKSAFHLPYNRKLVKRAKDLRRNMTAAEKKIWYEFLRLQSVRVLRQRPIDNYIVDFYCASAKLVIEIDGNTHSTEQEKEYDEIRTKVLEGYGLKVIRFTNDEVLNDFEYVCEKLKEIIPPAPLRKGGVF